MITWSIYYVTAFQINYIVALENSKRLRYLGKLLSLEYKEKKNRSWILKWWDKVRGIDYETQEKLVEDTYNNTFDPDEDNKVIADSCSNYNLYMIQWKPFFHENIHGKA